MKNRQSFKFAGHSSYFWWRFITTVALVIALIDLVLMPFLYLRINDAVETNKDVIVTSRKVLCSFGDLVQLSGSGPASRHRAIQGPHTHLEAELDFLTGIRDSHCRLIEADPVVQTEIQKTIDLIKHHLAQHPEGPVKSPP